MNPQNRSHLAVLLSFIAGSVVVTWPLILHFNKGVPYGGDAFQFIWNGWWVSKALGSPDLSIWWTDYQYAPEGTSLYLHDLSPVNAFMQAILTPLIGAFPAFNLLTLFHYILAAWGAYILAWYLTGNRAGSVVAGFIYGFSTFHVMHLAQMSMASMGWLPLSVYYLLKFARDAGWRDGILSVLMLIAAALSSWYHVVFAAILFFGLMLFGVIARSEIGGKSGSAGWIRAILVWAATALILSPIIINTWQQASLIPTDWFVSMGRLYYLDPAWLVLPSPNHPICGALVRPLINTIPGNMTEGVVSLGLVAIFLGLASWFRRDATTRAWCWLGLILFVLALGNSITFLGNNLQIPGPFQLWSLIPGLNLVRIPARFVEPFTLSVAMASAGWLAGLSPTWRIGWRRILLLWILPIFILLETAAIPIPIAGRELKHPALDNLPEIYMDATGDEIAPDLIIQFPLMPIRQQFSFQQTLHGLPTVNGAASYPPPGAWDFFFRFNWNPEYVKLMGVDMILYQPWAAESSLGEYFQVGDERLSPQEFFEEEMGYRIIYEDEGLVVFVP